MRKYLKEVEHFAVNGVSKGRHKTYTTQQMVLEIEVDIPSRMLLNHFEDL